MNWTSWGHIVVEAARLLGLAPAQVLDEREIEALDGERRPYGIIIPTISDTD